MHLLRRLRGERNPQRLPELRRRVRAAADPTGDRVASRALGRQASAVAPARPPVLQLGGYCRACSAYPGYLAQGSLTRSFGRQDRSLHFAKADPIAVALAPAAEAQGIAVFEKRPL